VSDALLGAMGAELAHHLMRGAQPLVHDVNHGQGDRRVGGHDLAEAFGLDAQRAGQRLGLGRVGVDVAAQGGEVAEELAGGQDIQQDVLAAERMAQQLDLAGGDDVQPLDRVPRVEDRLPRLVAALAEAAVDTGDILRRQSGKEGQPFEDVQAQIQRAHPGGDRFRLNRRAAMGRHGAFLAMGRRLPSG